MAAKTDASEQVRFLVSCIAHTNNGRPDFQLVAGELGIVSKAAAQKRYERMLKAHNVTKKPASADGAPEAAPKATPRKKRGATDDDEAETKPTPKKRAGKAVKKEAASEEEGPKPASATKPRARRAKPVKKEEPEAEDSKDEKEKEKETDEEAQATETAEAKEKKGGEDSPLSEAPPSDNDSAGDF